MLRARPFPYSLESKFISDCYFKRLHRPLICPLAKLLSFHFFTKSAIKNCKKGRPLEKAFTSSPFLLRGRVMGRERNGTRYATQSLLLRIKDQFDYLYHACQASHPQTVYKRGFSMRSSLAFLSERGEYLRYSRETEQIAGQRDRCSLLAISVSHDLVAARLYRTH